MPGLKFSLVLLELVILLGNFDLELPTSPI
jgi:hypothetical protein